MTTLPGRRRRRTAVLSTTALLAGGLAAPALAAPPVTTAATDTVASTTRYAGADRYGTSESFATEGYGVATSAIVTTGLNFPDALAGAYLAGNATGPVLLTRPEALSTDTRDALTELAKTPGFSTVYVLGGPNAVSDAVVTSIEQVTGAGSVVRVAGDDRYKTAVEIAKLVPGDATPTNAEAAAQVGTTRGVGAVAKKTAILATGLNFADALVAGPASASGQLPILLTRPEVLNADTAQALEDLGIERVVIAGGVAAISPQVQNALIAGGYEIVRLAGDTRNETAVEFAEFNDAQLAGFGAGQAGIALGWGEGKFADALTMAPLAGRDTFSILLTRTDVLPTGTVAAPSTVQALTSLASECSNLVVAGGTAAISDAVAAQAAGLLELDGVTSCVTTLADDGSAGSLRSVLGAASDDDVITLQAGETYTLSGTDCEIEDDNASGDIDITEDVTIVGNGATIDATGSCDRVFEVFGSEVAFQNLTITGGSVPDADDKSGLGGGIRLDSGSTVTITDSVITGNTASKAGGGVENAGGTLTVVDTDFTDNTAAGGVNTAAANGGAIHATGTTTVTGGTVSGNVAALEGGGFWIGGGATMSISGTTFTGNEAQGDSADHGGGALYNDGATLGASNVTIDGNSATGTSGSGGGILSNGGTLVVTNSTIDNNTANRAGGGIELALATVTDTSATLINVDFDSNSAGTAPGNGGALHASGGNVAISGGSVTNNTAQEGGGFWAGPGRMTVDGTSFTGNQGNGGFSVTMDTATGTTVEIKGGGALFVIGGDLDVTNADIRDNTATTGSGSGGAVLVDGGDFTISDSHVEGNSANRAGGAIELWGRSDTSVVGTVVASNTIFRDNAALGGSDADGAVDGPGNGGVLHVSGLADAEFNDSILDGNTAAKEGGAIWNGNGTTYVDGSTLTGNVAIQGGALFNNATGTILTANSTISGNSLGADTANATAAGSAIFNKSTGGVGLFFTTVADTGSAIISTVSNSGGGTFRLGSTAIEGICVGTVSSFNNNVATSATCLEATLKNRDVVGPLGLDALDDNGGPEAGLAGATEVVETHLATAGSATIDNGSAGSFSLSGNVIDPVTVDQRGFARGNDGDGNSVSAKDTGATEFGSTS